MMIKEGVRVLGLRPEIVLAAVIAESVYRQHGAEAVITSAIDGVHSTGSLHYAGCAIDLRISNINTAAVHVVHQKLLNALGKDYDVVIEKDHLHLEYQPKEAYT